MAVNHMPAERHPAKAFSGRTYPWTLGGLIIGADAGLLSGMADANTFTRDLVTLILWSVAGAILFSGILGFLGWLMDVLRPSALAGAIVGGFLGLVGGYVPGYLLSGDTQIITGPI